MTDWKSFNKMKLLLFKICRWLLFSLGIISFIMLVLSFTDLPYNAYHWLGTSNSSLNKNPEIIVLLGGSGMPSPDGLIRTYYTAEAANKYRNAEIIIAHPFGENDNLLQLKLMARELINKGIDSSRIKFAPLGFNTRSQAINISEMCSADKSKVSVLIVTSPEHMYRSINAFKKVGFVNVGGMAAFEIPIDEERVKDKQNAKDTRVKNLGLRYNMWSYLNYELIVMREYCAITYYKIKGWI